MIVSQAALPVMESLTIQKKRFENKGTKRICIVTGTHGDELEGQFVCACLSKLLQDELYNLNGTVDIYPALNPLGIDSIWRGFPMFDLDMNRIFPGSQDGSLAELVANDVVRDIEGAEICIDIHSSNIFLKEIPQVRISEQTADVLVPYAKKLNVDLIWVHAAATVLESTLAHSLNKRGVKTLVVEMGVGMRITKNYCNQLLAGILNLLKEEGMWNGSVPAVNEPILSEVDSVSFINSDAAGIFVPDCEHGSYVKKGQQIGTVLDPVTGNVVEYAVSPVDGLLFTLREYPIVFGGSLIARIIGG
jgi:predicted deacylase